MSGAYNPQYSILAILYVPPGNKSSNGFSNSNSQGTTTTFGSSVTNGNQVTFSGTTPFASLTYTAGFSQTQSESTYNTETTTTSIGHTIYAASDLIDHTQDYFYVWLNQTAAVNFNTVNGYSYSLSPGCGGWIDSAAVSAAVMLHPTLINPTQNRQLYGPQTVNPNNGCTGPGFNSICADPSQCTTSDFQTLLSQDPLVSEPSDYDPTEGGSSTRYIAVAGAPLLQFSGPETPGGSYSITTYSVTDGQMSGRTVGTSTSNTYTVKIAAGLPGFGAFGIGFGLSGANSVTYENQESVGTTQGLAHTATMKLGSSTQGCSGSFNLAEDTVYHTFVAWPVPGTVSIDCQ